MDLALNIFLWHFVSHYAQQPMEHMTFCNQIANGHWQTSPPLPFSILLEQIALFAQKTLCNLQNQVNPLNNLCQADLLRLSLHSIHCWPESHRYLSFSARNGYWSTDWGLSTSQKTGGDILDKCSYLVKLQKERRFRTQSNPLATLGTVAVEYRITGWNISISLGRYL